MDDRLLSEFLAEAEDLIEELYGDIAALRARRGDGRARREFVGRIFRQVHTIKGSAAAAGLEEAGELAHEFESLLEAVRAGRVSVDEEVLAACDDAVGAVAAALEAVTRGARAQAPEELIARLRRLATSMSGEVVGVEGDVDRLLPVDIARSLGAHERQRLREAAGEGASAYIVEADFDIATFDEQYRSVSDALGEAGEIVSTQPFVDADAPERVGFRIVYASAETRDEVLARVAPLGARVSEKGGAGRVDELADEVETVSHVSETPLTKFARVPLESLDELISEAHTLFADTLGALEFALANSTAGDERAELESRAARVRRGFSEMEGRLVGLRMVALHATLSRAVRAGEFVARAAGKSIEFETSGGEVMLDRSLADRVAEPLLHLIRNAVDHGIEDEPERRAAGKDERGRVRVEALSEEGGVVVCVSDDGRGIDAERVARTAAARGLIAPDTKFTDEQALRLIFRPGFSTASRVTLVSGRGVGLDVVERAVEEAGGEVRVRTQRGRSTVFELRLPMTLALLPAHILRSGAQRYCVGASRVVEIINAGSESVIRDEASHTLRWRGRELPLVHLRELLGHSKPDADEAVGPRLAFVIIKRTLRRGDQGMDEGGDAEQHGGAEINMAVAVDEWEGQRDVLVRGLGRHAKRWRGVSGATELRDGEVALVLDLPRLLETAEEEGAAN